MKNGIMKIFFYSNNFSNQFLANQKPNVSKKLKFSKPLIDLSKILYLMYLSVFHNYRNFSLKNRLEISILTNRNYHFTKIAKNFKSEKKCFEIFEFSSLIFVHIIRMHLPLPLNNLTIISIPNNFAEK
jgi:hypothetical protein